MVLDPLPPRLYRVYGSTSVSPYYYGFGFDAGYLNSRLKEFPPICKPFDSTDCAFVNVKLWLTRHLNRTNKTPTPFISVYSSKKEAYLDAAARVRQGDHDVWVCVIDTKELVPNRVREVEQLAQQVGCIIPAYFRRVHRFEWIVLRQIPDEAVVDVIPYTANQRVSYLSNGPHLN